MPVRKNARKNAGFIRKTFATAFTSALEMPEELALDLPKITLVGNVNLNVENHKGIISYSASEVRLRVSDGYLVARGSDFKLRSINRSDIFLEGEISNLAIILDMQGDGGVLSPGDLSRLLQEELQEELNEKSPDKLPAGEVSDAPDVTEG